MGMSLNVRVPNEPFSSLVRAGKARELFARILQEIKPESINFTEQHCMRGAIAIIDVAEPFNVPSICGPFFLKFNADCEFHSNVSRGSG
jgi:hypothetical protein